MAQSNEAERFTQTPEFKTAVAEAAAKAAAEAIAQLSKAGSLGASQLGADATQLFSQMALAIAEISDQGTHRKRVAPEILAQRAAARARCEKLVAEVIANVKRAREDKDTALEKKWMPEYRLIAKVALNERLVEPFRRLPDKRVVPNDIFWTGIPNQAMRPLNDIAKRIYAEYRESVGSVEKVKTADHRPLHVTASGLVVKGDAPKRREGFTENVAAFADELEVKADNNDPSAEFVNILGTVAAPARQNFQRRQDAV